MPGSSTATTTRRSISLRPLGPALGLVRLGAFRKLGAPSPASSTTNGCAGSSASRRCTPASPPQALSIYAVITYMDAVNGVSSPTAACTRCPVALGGRRWSDAGVEFRYDTPVTGSCWPTAPPAAVGRAAGRRRGDRRRRRRAPTPTCPSLPNLLPGVPAPRAVRRGQYSPSAVVWHVGDRGPSSPPVSAHHNIHFGRRGTTRSRRCSTTAGGCPTRRCSSACPRSTSPRSRPPGRHVPLRARARAQPRRQRSTGPRAGSGARRPRPRVCARSGTRSTIDVEVEPSSIRATGRRPGMERGTPFALVPPVLPDRPVPPAQRRPARPRPRVHRLRHRPGRRASRWC